MGQERGVAARATLRPLAARLVLLAVTLAGAVAAAPTPESGGGRFRIVSLTPHLTELMFAAGAGDTLVGTVDFSDYPPAARELPRVGSADRLDLETLVALRPDLVLAWTSGSPRGQVALIERLGIAVHWSDAGRLDQIPGELERLGRLAGHPGQAAAAARRFRDDLAALSRADDGRPPLRVFYQIWDQPLMTVNGDHLISDVLRRCGAVNIFAELGDLVPRVSTEAVLAADPDVIIVGAFAADTARWQQRWRGYRQLSAVARGRLLATDPDLLHRPTTRVIDGARQLCADLDRLRNDAQE